MCIFGRINHIPISNIIIFTKNNWTNQTQNQMKEIYQWIPIYQDLFSRMIMKENNSKNPVFWRHSSIAVDGNESRSRTPKQQKGYGKNAIIVPRSVFPYPFCCFPRTRRQFKYTNSNIFSSCQKNIFPKNGRSFLNLFEGWF